MRLKSYVINLEKSTVRRQYMQDLLSDCEFLDLEFLKAIDGRILSEEERRAAFDFNRCMSLYGKELNAGEVGCALSHRKAYAQLLQSDQPYALILEDDITVIRDLHALDLKQVDSTLNDKRPRVLMLSGDYWYYTKREPVVRLFSAAGAYAYVINRAAAQKILAITPPCCVADDWMFYKRKGLQLYAVHPYMIDANMNMGMLGSDVKQDSWSLDRSRMSLKEIVIGAFTGILKRLFKLMGHFEAKVRILNNEIVN